ncbi:MAG: alkaline phosphatase [Synergistaceae bacterium]|nr:alkaline phosphatase [Synergistaceae bacterium]
MKRIFHTIGAVLLVLLLFAAAAFGGANERAKYVFLFIGDGMGEAQVEAAELYSVASENGPLALRGLAVRGKISTRSANAAVTDSAAAGTALATGFKTNNGVLGMDPSGMKKLSTVAEVARDRGMKVGVVTSVFLNDATPAAFYAARPSRTDFYEIGVQMVESGFDYFAGGGVNRRAGRKGDLKDVYDLAREMGYRVLRTRAELAAARPGTKIIAAASVGGALPYETDRPAGSPSLAEFTKRGIELLDNPNGFFMMVEGGRIDWACHRNDAAAAIRDVLAFDAAVKDALAFARARPNDTLIVVLADHETGGMHVDAERAAANLFPALSAQRESSESFDEKLERFRKGTARTFERMAPLLAESFGLHATSSAGRAALDARAKKGDGAARTALLLALSEGEQDELRTAFAQSMRAKEQRKKDRDYLRRYGPYEPLSVTVTRILNRKAGVEWSSFAHTGVDVPVFAQGAGAARFAGEYDNTNVAEKILSVLGAR